MFEFNINVDVFKLGYDKLLLFIGIMDYNKMISDDKLVVIRVFELKDK